jgi:hypothetical protein
MTPQASIILHEAHPDCHRRIHCPLQGLLCPFENPNNDVCLARKFLSIQVSEDLGIR